MVNKKKPNLNSGGEKGCRDGKMKMRVKIRFKDAGGFTTNILLATKDA